MDEISNKTLAILLIGAIVISLGGTLISLNRLAGIRIPMITGLATDTAAVGLSIGGLAQVNWTTASINWVTGSVVAGKTTCRLDSYSNPIDTANCSGFTAQADGLVLENTGNKNVSLNISCGKNASGFIGDGSEVNAVYQWNVSNLEANSCGTNSLELTSSWQTASTTHIAVCNSTDGGFRFEDNKDTLKFDVMVVIPSDTPSGGKSDSITATATELS